MAEGDNPSRFTNTGTVDIEIAGGTAKGDPLTNKNYLPEGNNTGGRVWQYRQTGHKDVLPEHTARRTTHMMIYAR